MTAIAVAALMATLTLAGCEPAEDVKPPSEQPVVDSGVSSMNISQLERAEGDVSSAVTAQNTYYVSPDGSDNNAGTEDAPFRTLYYARDVLRKLKDSISGDVTVYLKGGYYRLFQPLNFTEEDSGKADGRIQYKALDPKNPPVLSGGIQLTQWQNAELNGHKMYKVKLQGVPFVRQFYAGDMAMPVASAGEGLEWAWVKASDKSQSIKLYGVDEALEKLDGQDLTGTELHWPVEWKSIYMPIVGVDSTARTVAFHESTYNDFTDMMETMIRQGQVEDFYPNIKFKCYLQNNSALLDEPGEWYYDTHAEELYFYPPSDVDMRTTRFFVPVVEDMIRIEGSGEGKVSFLDFDGIVFRHGAWNEPSRQGLIINQAQNKMVLTRTPSGKINVEYANIPANITVRYADNLSFKGCTFENMGTTALGMEYAVQNCVVQGNVFRETSEGGMSLSNDRSSDASAEQQCINNLIDNNVFHKIGLDYWSAPALTVYWAAKTTITHNYFYDLPYSGMSVGWGWWFYLNSTVSRENVISHNEIGKFMQKNRDGGGIYTLGQQPDSSVEYNYVYDQAQAFGGLYHDEGSAYFTTRYNVVDNAHADEKIFWIHVNGNSPVPGANATSHHLNVTDNWHSNIRTSVSEGLTDVKVEDNPEVADGKWPDEAKKVMDEAGLEAEYQHLMDKIKLDK